MAVAVQGDDLGTGEQADCGVVFDAANEITRHRVCQAISADQHVHVFGGLREKHCGLPCRIAAADDDDLLGETQLRFHRRRAVVHAGAFELREVLERRFSVFRAGGDDHRARRDTGSAVNLHAVRLPVAGQPGGGFRDHDLRAELLRLRVGAARKVQP